MRIKNITYQVVWTDDGDRHEELVTCDETKHVGGERQFLDDGQVKLAIATDALISYRRRRTRYCSPRSLSEIIEVAKMHYHYNYSHRLPLPL